LVAGLLAWQLIEDFPAAALCRAPAEAASSIGGHTTAVSCDGDSGAPDSLRGPARRLFGLALDLNCSDAPTLETLPGIGPARAQAIVDARRRVRYRRVDDLLRVPGIGSKTLERIRADVAVAGPVDPASVDSPKCRSEERWLPSDSVPSAIP